MPLHRINEIPEETTVRNGEVEIGYWTALGFLERIYGITGNEILEDVDMDNIEDYKNRMLPIPGKKNMTRIDSAVE